MIKNNASFDAYELSVIFGESNVMLDNDTKSNAVSTDSRTIEQGNMFVALKGEKFDGHDNINDALAKGASVIIAEKEWYESNKSNFATKNRFVIVKDSLDALGKLARFHRDKFTIPVIAVAGSNGKTTTKEIAAHILSQKHKTLKTYKNFNNRVGVPLMLLSLDSSHEAAVLELGTNEPGEIGMLSNISNPTHGIITNIGKEHLEFLVNLDGVEMEETFLFGYLRGKGGIALINMDDPRLAKYEPILENKLTYGITKGCGLQASYSLDGELVPTVDLQYEDQKISAKMQARGIAPALNTIAAASIAFILGMEENIIKEGIETYKNDEDDSYGRMKVIRHNSCLILNDTYNSNPSSMKMSLETLDKVSTTGKKTAILGDMFELGREAAEEHIAALKHANSVADEILLLGENMKSAAENIDSDKIKHFESHEALSSYLKANPDRKAVLVKGSRGMQMEKIVSELQN